jgi:hypothetical protein
MTITTKNTDEDCDRIIHVEPLRSLFKPPNGVFETATLTELAQLIYIESLGIQITCVWHEDVWITL